MLLQNCIIKLGIILSTFITEVTESDVAAELCIQLGIILSTFITKVTESGVAAELYN